LAASDPGFALYVHWPFCAAKCPYCDFNSHVRSSVDHDEWRQALVHELRSQAGAIGPRRLRSIFFGGGTPSLMAPRTIETIIDTASDLWSLEPDIEITMEANPTSVEALTFSQFKSAGINRVSVGVQALDDTDLKSLGRLHSADEAVRAFDVASRLFDRTSFDLIYARQNQSARAWEDELRRAINIAEDHMSLYQLTIEQETRFGELHARGKLRGLPSDDLSADLYELTTDICAAHGLQSYEVSNYARPGSECRHNLVYWRYGEYCGIGPGAHGRVIIDGARWATQNLLMPEQWLLSTNTNDDGTEAKNVVTPVHQGEEYLIMGLRLREGISLSRFEALSGFPLDETAITDLIRQKFIERSGDALRATKSGRLVLNAITGALLVT
jgi:oxygen-independent coproporphyrinogen-3 oxidase